VTYYRSLSGFQWAGCDRCAALEALQFGEWVRIEPGEQLSSSGFGLRRCLTMWGAYGFHVGNIEGVGPFRKVRNAVAAVKWAEKQIEKHAEVAQA